MTATISKEDQEVADALIYLKRVGVLGPNANQDDLLRYCVLSTAETVRRVLAEGGTIDDCPQLH